MSFVRKTITLRTQQDLWVKADVEKGHHDNGSPYIREMTQRDQARSAQNKSFRIALIGGESSGELRVPDIAAFKQRIAKNHG